MSITNKIQHVVEYMCKVYLFLFFRKPTNIEWRYTEEGERVRVSLRTGRIIPKPVYQRKDGIIPQQWKGESSRELLVF